MAIRRSNGVTANIRAGFFRGDWLCGGACISDGAHEGAFQTKAAIRAT
jgi:hypothetical protein